MSSLHTDNRRKVIAQIHIARKDLGLDDDTYRLMLTGQTGKRSCGDMNLSELMNVLAHLKSKGWKPKAGRISPKSQDNANAQVAKLRAQWITMAKEGLLRDGSEAALNRWVQRQSAPHNQGQGIANVEWLPPQLAQRLIEELKQWRRRLTRQSIPSADKHAD